MAGWRYRVNDIDSCIAVADGRKLASYDICGVLNRLPCVFEEDLNRIIPPDRAYVASEMNAFLLSWLTDLRCPVLNRPTPLSLLGPYWHREKWIHTAARLGIPVAASRRRVVFPPAAPPENHQSGGITIVGRRCFGAPDAALAEQARLLADAAGVDFLTVQFSGSEPGSFFMGASLCPDVIVDDVADALVEYLRGRSSCEGMDV